jgi:hypothetical protein
MGSGTPAGSRAAARSLRTHTEATQVASSILNYKKKALCFAAKGFLFVVET